MLYFCAFVLVLSQNIFAQEESLRMGFNHEKCEVSVAFPGDATLKLKNTADGNQVYFVNKGTNESMIAYEFGSHGFGLEGLTSFKDKYLADQKASFTEKNPNTKIYVILDKQLNGEKSRAIIESIGELNRTIFVGDFYALDGKLYVASEIIEVPKNDIKDVQSVIDEEFLNSFKIKFTR